MRVSVLLLLPLALACNDDEKKKAPAAPSASASAKVSPTAGKSSQPRKKWPIPTGPRLAIIAGKGIGPIRIGATVETVERHMDLKCQDKTEQVCRYVSRAVELMLTDGKVSEIRVHHVGRPAGKDPKGEPRTYGIFNGYLTPGAQLGMLQPYAMQSLGKPLKVEMVSDDSPFNTKERHHYKGLVAEYDQQPGKEQLVLGGVIIKPES